ncbi:hypothetical protein SDC9_196199 [bioreactor metagenome]|uniref:Uncharacterized protein n=1 Tax=bioreactor metagenome TaxID=1076179 RepID=A0A645IDQ1_9ZZZZ
MLSFLSAGIFIRPMGIISLYFSVKDIISQFSGYCSSPTTLSTIFEVISDSMVIMLSLRFSPKRTLRRSLYIISRWSFITWSYSSICLRIPKLLPSTFFWAFSIAFESMPCSIGSSSSSPRASITFIVFSEPKRRIRSSSMEI